MINPFDYSDYREFLIALCEAPESPRGFRADLSRAAGCQASYFSQVLKSRVHLTDDQMIGIAQHLNLISSEIDYLLLLVRYSKAGTATLKNYLEGSIRQAREEHLNLRSRTGASRQFTNEEQLGFYFSSWVPSAIHLLTSSPGHQKIQTIAQRLGLPITKVKETLELLERFGFVRRKLDRWEYGEGTHHVKKSSPFQSAVQSTRRELALRSISLNPPDSIHFSSLFTIDSNDLEIIKGLSAKFVEQSHLHIKDSGTSKLACLCVDVFEVV